MRINEAFKSSLVALSLNKTRSFLTMLGVIIGVFAVVSLVSFVQGIKNYIGDQFSALGSNLIIVSPGGGGLNSDPSVALSNNKLNEDQIRLIRSDVGNDLVGVTPNIRMGKNASYKTKKFYSIIVGGNSELLKIVDINLVKGRFYTESEVNAKAKVVIIGDEVRKELFENTNPVGKFVKLDEVSFEIIGVAEAKNAQFDQRILMPYTAAKTYLGVKNISGFSIKAKSSQDIDAVVKKVKIALLKDLSKNDFSVMSQKDILKSIDDIMNVLSIGLMAIAGISLLVGGIGIMNIMLVSATERTREVGLRKALGATGFDIGAQFLLEAVLISVTGGVIGLAFGWLSTIIAKQAANIRAEIPLWAVFLSLGFSIFIGVTFGTYPAVKASKKDPIESLRYE